MNCHESSRDAFDKIFQKSRSFSEIKKKSFLYHFVKFLPLEMGFDNSKNGLIENQLTELIQTDKYCFY